MLVSWLLSPLRMLHSIPRRVGSLSLAARVALAIAVFQLLVVILAIFFIAIDKTEVLAAWRDPGKIAVLILLLLFTPVLVYYAARAWLERDASRFPDILQAWSEAVSSLRRQGLDLEEYPLFLVIGTRSDLEDDQLFAEVPGELLVTASPKGDAALHVYGGDEGIFVSLASCSRLSDLSRTASSRPRAASIPTQPNLAVGEEPQDLRGTVLVDYKDAEPVPTAEIELPVPGDTGNNYNTIDIGSISSFRAPAATKSMRGVSASRDEMRDRLKYFCELLRRERAGLASLNGVLVILPGDQLLSEQMAPQFVGQALGDDLATVMQCTGVLAPVVALVLGLEHEPGFFEFMRRMPQAEHGRRLGQRFPIGVRPTHEQLGSLAIRACGSIEDVITARLFRSEEILTATGNARLAVFAARLRHQLASFLSIVLRRGFLSPDAEISQDFPFIAGCYLGAVNAEPKKSGFVRGVFERLLDCQAKLEWTDQELESDERAARVGRLLWGVCLIIMTSAGGLLSWWAFSRA